MGDRRSWEGAPKRDVSINFQEKSGGRAKKPEKYMIFDVLVPEMKKISSCLCLTVEHTDSTLTLSVFCCCYFIFIGIITTTIL